MLLSIFGLRGTGRMQRLLKNRTLILGTMASGGLCSSIYHIGTQSCLQSLNLCMSLMPDFSRLTVDKFGESMFLSWVVMGQRQLSLCLFQDPQTPTLKSDTIPYVPLKIQR